MDTCLQSSVGTQVHREREVMQVIGAGLGRTGTNSLKLALEMLLNGPCYHMFELWQHPEDVSIWQSAVDGNSID